MNDLRGALVVLTMGGRSEDLERLAASLSEDPAFTQADFARVLVMNGGSAEPPVGWDASWTVVRSADNLGVPGGRNFGIAAAIDAADPDVVILIDDDAASRTPHLVSACMDRFATEPDLGAVGFRIVVSDSMRSLRRWIPRVRGKDPDRSGDVTSFPGGGHAFRTCAFNDVGGYCGDFFYALEETEISWRLLNAGWRISYDAELIIEHPDTPVSRHPDAARRTARNRMWLARQQLPLPLAVMYVSFWSLIGLVRARSITDVTAMFSGSREGLASLPGTRRPMRWSTVVSMTRLGRPPLL